MRTARVAKRSKSKKPPKHASSAKAGRTVAAGRLKDTLIALEPRILFDAAAVVTGAEVAADQVAQEQAEAAVQSGANGENAAQSDGKPDPLLQALSTYEPPSSRREIVFLDTTVKDYQTLLAGIDSSAEVVLLDGQRDGVEQIAEALNGRTDIDAIHIVSHGDQARLQLGTASLTMESMVGEYADELDAIGKALTDSADILIYGCNFGEGALGEAAANQLSALTGADLAASDDLTGAQALGGDWDLEYHQGVVETEVAFSQEIQETWSYVLADFNETAWSGTQTYVDGLISFQLSLTGGGTIDWAYNGKTDTLTISASNGTSS